MSYLTIPVTECEVLSKTVDEQNESIVLMVETNIGFMRLSIGRAINIEYNGIVMTWFHDDELIDELGTIEDPQLRFGALEPIILQTLNEALTCF